MDGNKKYLHELLKEDQEPFHLKNYIADRRCLLKRSNNPHKTTSLQVKKRKPINVETSSTTTTISKRCLCKQACFFAFHDSPDVTKSPLFSPAEKIPVKTPSLLLEAAMRINQKQQSNNKSQIKNVVGFGLFSSILKKLKDRSNKNKSCEITTKSPRNSTHEVRKMEEKLGISRSCNNSRLSSAGWSERSVDIETCTSSCRSEEEEEDSEELIGSVTRCQKHFCSSPVSPFRFSLQGSSPSSGRRTPIFSSPAASPSRHKREDKESYEAKGLEKIQVEEDDEKEQCSPVSILDPPFDDDNVGEVQESEDDDEEDYDVECSFAIVQRTKEQLLYKLRRFEKLAELDPIELEKRMMEQLDDEDEDEDVLHEYEVHEDGEGFFPLHKTCNLDSFVDEVFSESDDILSRRKLVPADMKKLVSDLISEENREIKDSDSSKEMLLGRVCRKLDSWKEVESNTIDMMVGLDFRTEFDQWKQYQNQREESTAEIELAIFRMLLDELIEEL